MNEWSLVACLLCYVLSPKMADRPEHFEVFEWLRSSCTFVTLFESERSREELLPIGNLVSIRANSPFANCFSKATVA
jgi:hypothetical protein